MSNNLPHVEASDIYHALYTLVEQNDEQFCIRLADKHHSVFQAHFPDNPLLPGFMLLDISEKHFQLRLKKIKKMTFLAAVLPQDCLTFSKQLNADRLQIDITKQGERVAVITGQIVL